MRLSLLLSLLLVTLSAWAQHPAPANPDATPEARELLSLLYQTVDDGQILSGLHHNQLQMPNYRKDLDRIQEAAGVEPLIWGGDLAWDAATVVEMATEQYHNGHIITLMWHAARPFDTGIVNFKQQTQGKFSDAQWTELVTEGSEMHRMWIAQVDSIAQYLKVLQDRHIPVIWRPLHEMNGEWFWWGNRPGPEGYQKLWRMLYDRMTHYHHLNNLLWVWNANAVRPKPQHKPMLLHKYYPGADYVDVLATDVYHRDWRQCHHDDLAQLAHGKLIALGEVGSLPTPEQLAKMPKFAWFMVWTDFTADKYNTLDQLRDIFTLEKTQNLAMVSPLQAMHTPTTPSGTLVPRGTRIPASDARIQYLGRVSFGNPESPCFTFPSVQIRATFTGTSLRMVAKPRSGYFMAQIDRGEAFKVSFNSERDSVVTLATALPEGTHQVRLMYVTEGFDRRAEFRGFLLDQGHELLPPPALSERRMEFIGNSITCGYGVESTERDAPFEDETCNHYYTYAARTARNLGAEEIAVCRSGIGVYRNYNGPRTGDSINMNTEYAHTLLYDATESWDFTRYSPQVVCINLGTNDTSTTGADPYLLRQGYVRLLGQVRGAYPGAKIVFLCGSMMGGDALELARKTMDEVVNEANRRGDAEVYRFDFKPQDGSLGYGASWHPSYWQHEQMAGELTSFLRQLMGWY